MTGVGHDRHLSVTVNAPNGLLLSTVDDSKGQINFVADETGIRVFDLQDIHESQSDKILKQNIKY